MSILHYIFTNTDQSTTKLILTSLSCLKSIIYINQQTNFTLYFANFAHYSSLIPPPHHQPVPNPTSPLSLDRQLFDYPSLSQNPKPRPGRDEKQEPATRESRKKRKESSR